MSFYDYDVILEIALVKNQHQIQILNVNADGEGLKNITMNYKDTKKSKIKQRKMIIKGQNLNMKIINFKN